MFMVIMDLEAVFDGDRVGSSIADPFEGGARLVCSEMLRIF